jgi:hypothetical protein
MMIRDDEILIELINDLNIFAVGKTIEAIMFNPEAEEVDGFNIFFSDGSALLVIVQNGELFWKCATSDEMAEYLSGDDE